MFERFTDRARRVLVLAQEEARLLNHSFIGTEHILLGLIHEGDGLAARALESLGISLQAVREKVEDTVGPSGTKPTGSPPFTPRAKKVLELSLREALQLGHHYIGTEHLLLGLVREGEGVAAQVLQSLGADLPRVRQRIIQLLSGWAGREAAGGSRGSVGSSGLAGLPGSEPATAGSPVLDQLEHSLVVGRRWTAEVVRAGRRPSDFAAAYDQLTALARQLGLDLDGLDASRLLLRSVETIDGPGLRLSLTHDLPEPPEPEAEPEEGIEPEGIEVDDGGPDAPAGDEQPPGEAASDSAPH